MALELERQSLPKGLQVAGGTTEKIPQKNLGEIKMQEQFKNGDALIVMQMSTAERLDLLIKLIPAYHNLSKQFDKLLADYFYLKQENQKLKEQKGVGN